MDETNLDESIESSNFGEAQKHIIRGVLALIVFFIIILTPQVIELIDIASTNYDDDISYDADLDDESDSPCYAGEKYDEKDCFNERKHNLIIATILQILYYAIPVYGLIEIHRGVTKLFAGLEPQKNMIVSSTDLESTLDDDESHISENQLEQEQMQDNTVSLAKFLITPPVILTILLIAASFYLLSTMEHL